MAILIGTRDGVYHAATVHAEDAEQVLDSGDSPRVRTFPAVDGVFAATNTGLYRSMDDGQTWENLDVPQEEVYSVVASPDGERLYAGTHPAHLYVSTNSGETWDELEGFQELPSRDEWHTPRHRNEAHVRSLGVHPETPDRVIAGVEVGGVHLSDDQGETWTERRDGVHDDVHHVIVLGANEYIASCGDGLYRTRDAGSRGRGSTPNSITGTSGRPSCSMDGSTRQQLEAHRGRGAVRVVPTRNCWNQRIAVRPLRNGRILVGRLRSSSRGLPLTGMC